MIRKNGMYVLMGNSLCALTRRVILFLQVFILFSQLSASVFVQDCSDVNVTESAKYLTDYKGRKDFSENPPESSNFKMYIVDNAVIHNSEKISGVEIVYVDKEKKGAEKGYCKKNENRNVALAKKTIQPKKEPVLIKIAEGKAKYIQDSGDQNIANEVSSQKSFVSSTRENISKKSFVATSSCFYFVRLSKPIKYIYEHSVLLPEKFSYFFIIRPPPMYV